MITDWFEKIRNLVQWSDPSMTKLFLILLVVCFLVVTFLPMRFILSLSYFYKFWKGRSWQRRRINNNQEVCRIELAHFLEKNKLQGAITNYNEKWDVQIKKEMKKAEFESKLITQF